MGVVVHGVNTPLVARFVVMGMPDSIKKRISHFHVRGGHIDAGSENVFAVGEFARSHFFK